MENALRDGSALVRAKPTEDFTSDSQRVEPFVDEDDLSGDRATEIAGEKDRGVTHLVRFGRAAQRGALRVRFGESLEPGDPSGCQRRDRAGRDGVDTYALWPQ